MTRLDLVAIMSSPALKVTRPALLMSVLLAAVLPASAAAQEQVSGIDSIVANKQEQVGETRRKLTGQAELKIGDSSLYADDVEIRMDQDLLVATGNVVLAQGANRIAAERGEFNYKTKTGTFYDAYGFASIKPPPPPAPQPGAAVVPTLSGQETDVYFYGKTVEKLSGRKYRITTGGFTTCVQPTPRWHLTAATTVLNLEHYTVLRDAVFFVKGVPMLYTPFLYYPTKKEDRATGFLLPTLGATTLRGESIHNAFFWVLGRSQDLTFAHDWFTKTGQGAGSEYRYNFGLGSNGNLRVYGLAEHAATYVTSDGLPVQNPGSNSYEVHGSATQELPASIRARGRVDYFSSLTESQSFNMNYTNAYANQRSFGGNLIGAWGTYTMNATLDHTEFFQSGTASNTTGSWPRISFNRNERLIPGTPLYFSVGSEYASLLRNGQDTANPDTNYNQNVTRLDFTPQLRYPFKKWQWFTINSTVSWRDTHYSRSTFTDPVTGTAATTDDPLNRRFFTMQAQLTGPVFTKIWDTPNSEYAEKFKHTIEPFLNISRTTAIDNFSRIIQIDNIDTIYGGTTQYAYGVNNRFYAKRPSAVPGQPSQAREILDVQVTQTYYTQSQAAEYDPRYQSSLYQVQSSAGPTPSNFSPIQFNVRGMPTNDINANVTVEVDSRFLAVRQISAGGSYAWSGRVQTNASWSKQGYIPQLPGFNDPTTLTQAINGGTNVHTKDNRVGGIYSFSYDFLQGKMLQQRVSAFYNAQCCGVAFEFQTFNYGGITAGLPVPADHRFFLSFTLAGLGAFSPFNGAMSGVPR